MQTYLPTHLPTPKQVRDLLVDLLGKEVTLSQSAPFAPGPNQPASIAVYTDDSLRPMALIAGDLKFSAYAGGALALVPLKSADEAVEAGTLDQTLAETLYEVLNIASSMFNEPNHAHLRLHQLHPAGVPLDPMVRAQALTLGRREDLSVDIAGYGVGRLSLVMIA
ncbi:hypothetical protein [Nocardioides sp. Kera G14]|uniref:hypothetical protein n=1 Tax=Nocardioides sp. Kera G14 TaxID=2884264 RepID=UPI001D121579|nr:hypothetical protein [Nocardioides sp. Kera G14]UDY24075.1 hypothetical protein LH076_01900 [Nocardioides sp. Kera G14]